MKKGLLALAAAVLALPAHAADDAAAMHKAADGFYGVYRTFHPSDGIPDDAGRARYRPYLSPALDTLLTQAGDAERRYDLKYKDSPPLIEGDLFSSLFEGATDVSVGACTAKGATGSCVIRLSRVSPRDKPVDWTDTLILVETPYGWRVDDIAYGGDWAFGNKGRLSETLRQVIQFQ